MVIEMEEIKRVLKEYIDEKIQEAKSMITLYTKEINQMQEIQDELEDKIAFEDRLLDIYNDLPQEIKRNEVAMEFMRLKKKDIKRRHKEFVRQFKEKQQNIEKWLEEKEKFKENLRKFKEFENGVPEISFD